jgi:hypothetical protein
MRQDPINPHHRPPERVKVWADRDGDYLPLDNRLIKWLYEADLSRKFRDYDQRRWAELFERELAEEQARLDADKQKRVDEQHEELADKLALAVRKGERGAPVNFAGPTGKKVIVTP